MTTDWCYNNRSEQDTVQPPHQDELTEGAVKNDDGADHRAMSVSASLWQYNVKACKGFPCPFMSIAMNKLVSQLVRF